MDRTRLSGLMQDLGARMLSFEYPNPPDRAFVWGHSRVFQTAKGSGAAEQAEVMDKV